MLRDGVAIVLRALFVLYVLATALHIGLVTAWEPFAFDAWNVAHDTRAEPFSLGNWLEYGVGQYTHSNPRLGQWFAYLAYKLEYFAPIATPLAYLALALAVTVLGLGRFPSFRHGRGRDLALLAFVIGALWFAIPRIGMILFSRGYCTNYVYTAAIQLWMLVPLRLVARGRASTAAGVAYFVLGVLAGACNEHTGPTLLLFLLGYAVWCQRRTGERPSFAWAGAVGAVVGFAAIFFAPGQGQRYDGLATQLSLVGRLLQRGFTGNLDIYRDYVIGAAPVLALLTLVLVVGRNDVLDDGRRRDQRRALRLVALALAAGSLITATVFVSPKLGARFYLHSCALLLAAFVAVADTVVVTTRRLVPLVLIAVTASVYAGTRTIPLYLRLDERSDERLAALAAAPRGSIFTAESFDQVDDSWWFLGDDFRDIRKREMIMAYFDLGGVILRAGDLAAPLGVSDVRLVPRYEVSSASCLDQHGGLELAAFRGLDVASIHKASRAAIEALERRVVAAGGRLTAVELRVGFVGDPPPGLPVKPLLASRWSRAPDGTVRWQAYAGSIARRGAGKTRTLTLPKELRGTDAEIFIYQVGSEARRLGTARDAKHEYVPWRRGAYWALACDAEACFVIAATRLL